MPQAWWNGRKIADSDDTVVVEGNHYFPPDSLDRDVIRPSPSTSGCPWKGTAQYYTAGGGRRGEQGRGVVLSRTQIRRRTDSRAGGVLEGCGGAGLMARHCSSP